MSTLSQSATRTLTIDGMTCGHCVSRVTRTLSGIPGLTVVDVQVGSATVRAASEDALKQAVDELASVGYKAAVAPENETKPARSCGTGCCCN
ncbi:MAG TPA: heavy-metal-associated domain-containing protein [Phycisphaerales bacterium]|nr:heavy-metal-associated domain-containing protein [Phycisphaerales bacterium]